MKKVVQRNGGSGCLRDMDLVTGIIRAVIGATHLPVTVKTRSGWSDQTRDPVSIALRMQDAGAKAFTLHARTRTQMFSGKANWDEIASVVEALDIPVIGNGDLETAADIVRMREHTGCAGAMVGRGAFGNPWLFRDGQALLAGEAAPPLAIRAGAVCRGARACPAGHPAPGRHSANRHGVPQAPRLVHPRPARVQRPQTAPLPDRIDRGSRGDLPRISRACRPGGVTAEQIEALLAEVAAGRIAPHAALEKLRHLPFEDLPFARIDHHRALRQGQPEVVFCEGKTPDQIVAICERLEAASGSFLGTRASETVAQRLQDRFPRLIWNPTRAYRAPSGNPAPERAAATGPILVISAGTSDLPVAEEAAVVAEAYGHTVERLVDVGVAGLHRLLAAGDQLRRAQVVIVVAGMEGALPSVVGGMLRVPVIAVPTSVGYGASFGGLAALLGMLNSCAAGVTVVNIDNGFGAAVAASRILPLMTLRTIISSEEPEVYLGRCGASVAWGAGRSRQAVRSPPDVGGGLARPLSPPQVRADRVDDFHHRSGHRCRGSTRLFDAA